MPEWTTPETEEVFEFLEREDVKPTIVEGTKIWDERKLLGIQLADRIEELVRSHTERNKLDTAPLEKVDWYQLATYYALEISGVDEDELLRRHNAAGGDL